MLKKIVSLLVVCMMLCGIVAGCAESDTSSEEFKTLADFETARIGIMTGSSHERTAKELFPDAKRVYFNTVSDMVLATEQGKIDGYITETTYVTAAIWEGRKSKR